MPRSLKSHFPLALANALFDAPLAWPQIIQRIASLDILPTSEGSAEISTWYKDVRAAGLFSARTNSAAYLAEVQKQLQDFASGKTNMATVQMNLQGWLKKTGYTPEGGFPGETSVPPANSLLQNLASDQRIKLVIDTLSSHALNTGYAQSQNTPSLLFNFPCWEFLRLAWRKHPRGSSEHEGDEGWPQRWVQCGGELHDGRMIAPKDSDIWEQLGDSGTWPDGLDSDVPPFAFNSGYGWIAVPRAECVTLGVIDAGDGVQARNYSLLGMMFDRDPKLIPLSEITAKKQDLLAALAMLKQAA